MRVVAGTARGRKLETPKGTTTRPTGDRVRQATFNALDSMGVVADADVLDLFAGSGAMGIEALSRGAAHVTFVDHDRHAVAAVEANLSSTGLGVEGRATVVQADALRFLAGHTERHELVVLDPPYGTDDETWVVLLDALDALDVEVVVCESNRAVTPPPPWHVRRAATYGGTVVVIAVRRT